MKRIHSPKKVFDFDLGYLVKSPCRDCFVRYRFPACMDDCQALDKVQRALAKQIPSTKSHSSLESFALLLDNRSEKQT